MGPYEVELDPEEVNATSSSKSTPLAKAGSSRDRKNGANDSNAQPELQKTPKTLPKTPLHIRLDTGTISANLPSKVTKPTAKTVKLVKDLNSSKKAAIDKMVVSECQLLVQVLSRPTAGSENGGSNCSGVKTGDVSSGRSSPFTAHQRVETAGTHFSNMSHMSRSGDATGGDTTKILSTDVSFPDSQDLGDNLESNHNAVVLNEGEEVDNICAQQMNCENNFSTDAQCGSSMNNNDDDVEIYDDSPSLNRTRSLLLLKKQAIVSMLTDFKRKLGSSDIANSSMQSNVSVDCDSAPLPGKYPTTRIPVYEPLEENVEPETTYWNLIGKEGPCGEANPNESEFIRDAKLTFDEWIQKGSEFEKEQQDLNEKAIIARMKFDKRFQFILDNLDEFAMKLEKCGEEINKRSEILKEYCSKIVDQI